MLDYTLAIINLIIVNFFISLIFKKHASQLIVVLIYYFLINLIFHHNGQLNREDYIYIIEVISIVIASYFIHKTCSVFKKSISNIFPYIKIGNIFFANDKRIYVLFGLLSAVLAVTSTLGIIKYHNIEIISPAFYTSWSVDVVFFIIIGFSIASIGLRLPHLEDFSTRVGILFSGVNIEESLKSPALSSMEEEIKQLGLMVKESHRQITVTDYNAGYDAFKIQVTTTSTLISMFGDVDASDKMNFTIIPDDFSKQRKKPKLIGMIVSLFVEGFGEKLSQPLEIFQDGSEKLEETFSVGSESKTIVLKYWSWVKPDEALGFRPKRFCGKHSVTIVNRVTSEADTKISLKMLLEPSEKEIVLSFGQRWETHFKGVARGELKQMCSLKSPKS